MSRFGERVENHYDTSARSPSNEHRHGHRDRADPRRLVRMTSPYLTMMVLSHVNSTVTFAALSARTAPHVSGHRKT
jgi:hypothetical protein